MGRTKGARYALRRRVRGLETETPIRRITAQGNIEEFAALQPLSGGAHWVVSAAGAGDYVQGLPPFVTDLAPQEFLGPRFAHNHPEFELPQRLTDWSDDHRLIAVARRIDDGVGDLVLGEEAFSRLLDARQAGTDATEAGQDDYPKLASEAPLARCVRPVHRQHGPPPW